MRPHQIFAAMQPDHSEQFFGRLAAESPAMFNQAVHAAAVGMKARPQYLLKQPLSKRAAAVRRTLARVSAAALAEEILAIYFLECRQDMLGEWLDLMGLEHEKGILSEDAPSEPNSDDLTKNVASFRTQDDDADRLLLLRAFAAQRAIEWPTLDGLIES